MNQPFGPRLNGDDEIMAPVDSFGPFGASWLTGDLQTGIAVAPNAALLYRGLSLSDPILAAETSFSGGAPIPDEIEVRLTLGGVAKDPVWYSNGGLGGATSPARFALQIDDSTLSTGRYEWEMLVISHYGDETATRPFSGMANVVRPDDGGGFGTGWTLAGLDRLVAGTGGVLFVRSDGAATWFADAGNGAYTSPAGPLADTTLTLAGGTYTLTDKFGNEARFNSAGRLTARVDRNGNTVSFAWTDADGDTVADELSSITDLFNRTTTFAYTGGLVSSVTDIASRVTTLGRDASGRLTTVSRPDPDGAGPLAAPVTTYTYTAAGLLASVADPLNHTTGFAYNFAARLQQATNPDSTTKAFDPVQMRGLVDTGSGVGTQANPAGLYLLPTAPGNHTNELSHTSSATTDRFGFVLTQTNALGHRTEYQRDADGRVTKITTPDPDGNGPLTAAVTQFQYDTSCNLTQITFADNSTHRGRGSDRGARPAGAASGAATGLREVRPASAATLVGVVPVPVCGRPGRHRLAAEQAIRPAAVNRKVWGGNRTDHGARAQQVLTSVLVTCTQHARNPLDFLSRTLRGQQPPLLTETGR